MPPLKIVQAGHPVLRSRARTLAPNEIRSRALQELIERMRETMRDAPGVGLAAPQIGEPLQLAVVEDREEYQRNVKEERLDLLERRPVPFHVLINPRITLIGGMAAARFFEGCLSVTGMIGLVPRALDVHVDALDERGEPVSIDAHGWHARILQHEIDHLAGVLCVDRMYTRTLMTQETYAQYWGNKSIEEVWDEIEPERSP
ncbi:MAG TPA: peptide deformylase [Polyangiaceae bacterium]|nr:peptide deformylase [Polyangiaceae bacterium]